MKEYSYIQDLQTGEKLRFDYFAEDSEISDSVSVEWGETAIIGRSEPFRTYGGTSKRSLSVSLMFCGSVTKEDEMLASKFQNFDSFSSEASLFEFNQTLSFKQRKLSEAIRLKNESILISSGQTYGPNFSPTAVRRADNSISNISGVNVNDAVPLAWRVVHQVNFLRSFLYPVYIPTPDGRNVQRVDKPPMAFISLATFLKFKGIVVEVTPTWRKPFLSSEVSLPIIAEVNLVFDVISDSPYDSRMVRNGLMGTAVQFSQNTSFQKSQGQKAAAPKSAAYKTAPANNLPARYQNGFSSLSDNSSQRRAALKTGTVRKPSPVVKNNRNQGY